MAKKKQSARAAPPSEPLLAESEDIEDEFAAGATRIALEPGAAGSDEELDDQVWPPGRTWRLLTGSHMQPVA